MDANVVRRGWDAYTAAMSAAANMRATGLVPRNYIALREGCVVAIRDTGFEIEKTPNTDTTALAELFALGSALPDAYEFITRVYDTVTRDGSLV
jgi:hypothetical protein